jgi:hypothetical protein
MTGLTAKTLGNTGAEGENGTTVSGLPAPAEVRQKRAVASVPERAFELDTVASCWQSALDSAQRALTAAGGHFGLPAAELDERRRELVRERQETAHLLAALAKDTGVPAPRLPSAPVIPRMLGRKAQGRRLGTSVASARRRHPALAELVEPEDLSEDYVIPSVFDRRVAPAVAAAVSSAAEASGSHAGRDPPTVSR